MLKHVFKGSDISKLQGEIDAFIDKHKIKKAEITHKSKLVGSQLELEITIKY